jgi:hypothetical protein
MQSGIPAPRAPHASVPVTRYYAAEDSEYSYYSSLRQARNREMVPLPPEAA